MHPLSTDLTTLSDKELTEKIFDIQRRLSVSYRLRSGELAGQLLMILEDYMFEQNKRNTKQLDELISKSGKTFKDIIDIG